MFFVASCNDGIILEQLEEEILLERLNSNYYGGDVKFLTEIPESIDGFWPNKIPESSIVIINGEISSATVEEETREEIVVTTTKKFKITNTVKKTPEKSPKRSLR